MTCIKWIVIASGLLLSFLLTGCLDCDSIEPIEIHYSERGVYETTGSSIPGYALYYPQPLTGNHPVITWGNGTYAVPVIYEGLLDHFASWGFVVIASTSTMTGSGKEMVEGIDWLIHENSREESVFFNRLDIENIGATGHSQGGGGAINAGTDPRVKCIAPIEPIPGDVARLNGPMFLVGGGDDRIVPVSWIMTAVYEPSTVPTVFGIAECADHLTPLGDGGIFRGYLTAWFCGERMGHAEARDAFYTPCEICKNDNWTTHQKNQPIIDEILTLPMSSTNGNGDVSSSIY